MITFKQPKLLSEIILWEKEFGAQLPEWQRPSELYLGIEGNGGGGYFCSPSDAIKFADTGMDGIHYALLTDFSADVDLENAPVMCISPMDFGNAVRLVAKNLTDFFAIQFSDHTTILLNHFESKEMFLKAVNEEHGDTTLLNSDQQEWLRQKRYTNEQARKKFNLPVIEEPYEYMEAIRSERELGVVLRTDDGLGIMPIQLEKSDCRTAKPHPWAFQEIALEADEIFSSFLANSQTESKLAFIRDFQAQNVTNKDILNLLCHELIAMGLSGNAIRLRESMDTQSDVSSSSEYSTTAVIQWSDSASD